MRNSPANVKVREGRRSAPDVRADTPLQPTVKTTGKQAVCLQHMEVSAGACGWPHMQQVDKPWSDLQLVEQSIPEKAHPMERMHARAAAKELQMMQRTPHWIRGEHEEEEVAKTKYYELNTNPIPDSQSTLTTWMKENVEDMGIKEWSLGKRGGGGNFLVLFSLCTILLCFYLAINQMKLPVAESVCLWQ